MRVARKFGGAIVISAALFAIIVAASSARQRTTLSGIAANVAPPHGPPGSVELPPEAVAGFLRGHGVDGDPSSCPFNPAAAGCPSVPTVFVSIGKPGDVVAYGPDGWGPTPPVWGDPSVKTGDQGTRRRTQSAKTYDAGGHCYVRADAPWRVSYSSSQGIDYAVRASTANSCDFGTPVTYMEESTTLYKSGTDVADDWSSRGTAGLLTVPVEYNCKHTASVSYTDQGLAYTIYAGVGYVGYANGGPSNLTCPDSY